MTKRALVMGSETGYLQGANRDAERMCAALVAHGFGRTDIDFRTDALASRAGILDGWARITTDARAGDVVIVYYSGHGSLETCADDVETSGPFARKQYQAIVPFDYQESTAADFRGILAEELSILLWKLLAKTQNVAVILDCCHSALMSRGLQARPKAFPHPLHVGIGKTIEAILSKEDPLVISGALRPQGSDAVRLVACRQEQSAYEHTGADGLQCGIFTEGLLLALADASIQSVTWRELGERASEYVQARFPIQLPAVEGRADRLLFDLREQARSNRATIVDGLNGWLVRRGRIHGAHVGDVYSIHPPVGLPDEELGQATITKVEATESLINVTPKHDGVSPEGAQGVQIEWAEPPRLVHVPADSESRDAIVRAINSSKRLCATDASDNIATVIATVFVRNGSLSLLDADMLPVRYAVPATSDVLAKLPYDLQVLTQVRAMRELHGEGIAGVAPDDLEFEWGLVLHNKPMPLPPVDAAVGPGDSIYLRARNNCPRPLFVHIFDIGIDGSLARLTRDLWPTGLRLEPGSEEILFRDRVTGKIYPTAFDWPDSVPKEQGLRQEELLMVATKHPADLTALEQRGVTRGRVPREKRLKLEQLIQQANVGTTRNFGAFSSPADDGILTKRIFLWASPLPVYRGEARFLIDEQRPIVELIAQPRGWAVVPKNLAVVIQELVVHKNRALFGADIRVDALFVTPTKSGVAPYHAGTMRFANVHDGDRLPLDQVLVYMGPVKDFLQVCLWVSRDVSGSIELSDMLKSAGTSEELKEAMTVLLGLTAAAPQAALAVGAIGAAVTLVDVGYRLLVKAVGQTIGVYRTSLLAMDGYRIGRHPQQGLIRAQDFSFSLNVRCVS